MSGTRLHFAVVGVGMIGHRHIAMIGGEPEAELVAVCDIRSAEECDAPEGVDFYSSLGDMLAGHPETDVVCICTPNGLHYSQTAEVLRSGRNVVLEKPMALTASDAQSLIEIEKASRGRIFCVFQNRYTPTSQWIKQMLTEGRLGRLSQVVVNCLWNRDGRYYKPGSWHGTREQDGGTLFTQFSHYIDILLWLVGPVDIVAAQFADFAHRETTDFEDTGNFLFRTREGALGSFNYSTAVALQNMETSMVFVGTKGSVKIGGQYMSEVSHCVVEDYEMPQLAAPNPPNDYGAYKGSAANHCYVFANVVKTLLHGGTPTVRSEEGLEVIKTIEAIYALRTEDFSAPTKLVYRP